jgi:hypothetical protein
MAVGQLEGNETLAPTSRVAVSSYTLQERKRDIANLMAIAFDQVSYQKCFVRDVGYTHTHTYVSMI